jgi:hypothetical protein
MTVVRLWHVGLLIGVGITLPPRDALAQGVVTDCSPATVVASATGQRQEILQRGKTFHDWAPDYQQDNCLDVDDGTVVPRVGACHAPVWWRTDCSGFVSSTWSLTGSLDTSEFGHSGTNRTASWQEKSWDALEPGDAINSPGDHIALFTGWLDEAHTSFCVLEEVHAGYTDMWGGLGCIADAHEVAVNQAEGFFPIGLVGIDPIDGGASDASLDRDAAPVDAAIVDATPGDGAAPDIRSRRVAPDAGCSVGASPVDAWWTVLPLLVPLRRRRRPRR